MIVLPLLAVPVFAVAGSKSTASASETPWVKALHAKARVISGGEQSGNGKKHLLAGIHVKLEKDWKTYWRHPGDAGLPPSFNFSGSKNLKSATVKWPAPKRLADPYGASIGYKDEVVFPVLVEPEDPSQPVRLAVNFEYAVCDDICIPAEARLSLDLKSGEASGSPYGALLTRYLAQVPLPAESDGKGPSLKKVDIDLSSGKPHITIDAVFPGGTKGADLFIEAPSPLYVPMAEKVKEGEGGTVRYMVDLTKGDDPAELKGKTLTFTLVSKTGNREATRKVD